MITKLSLVPECSVCTRPGGTGSTSDTYLIGTLNRRLAIDATDLDSDPVLAGNDIAKLMIVASGHGSVAGRKLAASMAVESVCDHLLNSMHRFVKLADERDNEFRDELAVAMERCQRRVGLHQAANPQLSDIGASMTVVYLVWPRAYLVHVGNTRGYLFRNHHLRQLTTDHTIAQKFADQRTRPRADLHNHSWNNTIWNCIGGADSNIAPEIIRCDLRLGDRLMLLTPGLTDHLSEPALQDLLVASDAGSNPQGLADEIVHTALRTAGDAGVDHDDMTVLTADF